MFLCSNKNTFPHITSCATFTTSQLNLTQQHRQLVTTALVILPLRHDCHMSCDISPSIRSTPPSSHSQSHTTQPKNIQSNGLAVCSSLAAHVRLRE